MSLSIPVSEIIKNSNNALLSKAFSWERVILSDICFVLNGFAFKSKFFNSEKRGLPIIRIRDVLESTIETYYSGDYPKEYIINEGDILIGMDVLQLLKNNFFQHLNHLLELIILILKN